MDYLETSRIITIFASAIITIGLYEQSYKIWKTRSAKDFTFTIFLALLINELAWLNYGIALNEWPIILLGAINIPGVVISTIGYFKFGRPHGL